MTRECRRLDAAECSSGPVKEGAVVIRTMFAVMSAVLVCVLPFGGVAVAALCAFPQEHAAAWEEQVVVAEASPDVLHVQSNVLLR
jgi:hypothetical protein